MIYDVCIIGSGAGASPVAYELSRAGFNVVVLEKGKFYTQEDFSKDELAISRRKMFIPNLKDEYHIVMEKEPNGEVSRYGWYVELLERLSCGWKLKFDEWIFSSFKTERF